MPDLSENLINEERTWEEINQIKSMLVPMAEKKQLKAQLQVSEMGSYKCALIEVLFKRFRINLIILTAARATKSFRAKKVVYPYLQLTIFPILTCNTPIKSNYKTNYQ